MAGYIKDKDVYALFDERRTARLHVGDIDRLERIYFPAECASEIARGRRP